MKGFKGCDATNHLQIWLKLNFWAVKYNYLINYQSYWGKSALYINLILSLLNSQTLNTSCKNSKLKEPFRKCHWTWSLNLYALCNMLPNVDAIIFLKQFFLQFKLQLEELKKKSPLMFSWRFPQLKIQLKKSNYWLQQNGAKHQCPSG